MSSFSWVFFSFGHMIVLIPLRFRVFFAHMLWRSSLSVSLPICVSFHQATFQTEKLSSGIRCRFFWMWSCVLLPKLRIKHITLHVCQLIGLIAALNRFNVSPRQCGGFTDNLQLHDAHGEKRLGPLGPAPVLWTQHVKCLRQNSCLFMKTRVGGRGGAETKDRNYREGHVRMRALFLELYMGCY